MEKLINLIQRNNVRFTNLETTIHNNEGVPAAVSGGTWAMSPPSVLDDIKKYGFNLIGWANNHSLDYGSEGLHATARYLDEKGFVHAGVGRNLSEASDPKYLDTPSGRIALIALTSTFHESNVAGEQRRNMVGRPGINPLRHKKTMFISKDKMNILKEIANSTAINAVEELAMKDGFMKPYEDGKFLFGNYDFVESEEEGATTEPSEKDVERVVRSIKEAKRQADIVLISLHAHEMEGYKQEEPAEFLQTFSRKCIDEGADAIIGHGPHIIRGVEIYQGKPIFYSLGNFIFQNETVPELPADFYEKYSLTNDHTVADAFDTRSENNTIGFAVKEGIWQSVVAEWVMEEGKVTEILLHPIELGFKQTRSEKGWPILSEKRQILENLQGLSETFGTKIEINENIGRITL
ncbi:CapA family protein [Evansella sp. AB-rgal1]|uniref:CapA family protein n=1 Tax=Evansella sp. AB-rgal1 TaxID=3242696 RepID=UPI00359F10FE